MPVSFSPAHTALVPQVNFYKLPACPHTSPFSGKTVLRLDPVDNLIIEHSEEWDDPPGDGTLAGSTFTLCQSIMASWFGMSPFSGSTLMQHRKHSAVVCAC